MKSANVAKGLYMIQTNLSLSTSISDSWVLDTTCGSHLCKSLQDLQEVRNLNRGDFCWKLCPKINHVMIEFIFVYEFLIIE